MKFTLKLNHWMYTPLNKKLNVQTITLVSYSCYFVGSVVAIFFILIVLISKIKRAKCQIYVSKHPSNIFLFCHNTKISTAIVTTPPEFHVIQFVKVKFVQFAYGPESILVSICRMFACVSRIFVDCFFGSFFTSSSLSPFRLWTILHSFVQSSMVMVSIVKIYGVRMKF